MGFGSVLGGVATGYGDQQAAQLAAQKQSFVEQQTQQQQAQTALDNVLKVAADTVKAATDAGKDPSTVAQAIQPLIQSATGLANRIGGPQYAQQVQAMGQAFLSRPALEESTKFTSHVVTDPNTLQQSIVSFDTKTGAVNKVTPVQPGMSPTVPGAPATAAIPTAPAAPASVGGGLTPGDITPAQAAAVNTPAASAPVQMPTSAVPAPAPGGVGGLTADAIEFRARQWVDGNPEAFKNLPRNKMMTIITNAITNRGVQIAKEAGISPEELNARTQQFKATTAGAQVLGKREATLAGGIALVTATAPIVADLSSKIDRTNYPLINQIEIAGREQTGDPLVVRLGIALNTVTNAYARVQGGGNNQLTDNARAEARHLLQLSYSDGQLQAGVDQLLIEMQREKHEVGGALAGYLKLKKQQEQQNQPAPVKKFITPGGIGFTVNP